MAKKIARTRYIALLRGINVGGHRVKMDDLRRHFESLRFSNVSTYIASGNVIFETPAGDVTSLEQRIEDRLERALGYEVATFLRTPAELAAIAAHRPFPAEAPANGHSLYVIFLRGPLDDDRKQKFLAYETAMDQFQVFGREIYWWCRGKLTDSLVPWPILWKAHPLPSTMRNVTTVRKLADLYPVE